ncbi:MAG: GcvT family protein [Gammaproteobacteria bacterium]
MAKQLPTQAQVVIIGGGAIGCSVAYHLTKLGMRDVVLLERQQLSSGTTWHAAGLVGQLRANRIMTELARYSAELFDELEIETGQAVGYKRNGSLFSAPSEARMTEIKRGVSMARLCGLEPEILSPAQTAERYPILRTDDLIGTVFVPGDGQLNPADLTQAYAKGARTRGASVFERAAVRAIHQDNGRVTGVTAEHAGDRIEIACEYVVNCAGMWGREVGAMCGVHVPLHAAEHFYIVTEPMDEIPSDLPVMRDQDNYIYVKEDAGKLLIGCFEPEAKPWGMKGIPEDFSFETLPEDWEHFEPIMEKAMHRFPLLERAGIKLFFNGPESFTPDDRYSLGEAPNLRNFYVAAGFNSIGVQSSGGVGKVLAEWIENGHPPDDLWEVDVHRWMPFQVNERYLHDRTVEGLGLLYAMHWPFRQVETARGVRHSPLHARLSQSNACFGEANGWERPNWFAPAGVEPRYEYSFGRQNWFEHSAEEHRAVREQVGLFDLSSFVKFELTGADAEQVLNRVCANNVSVPVGRIVYTQWLNERGGIEADLTVTRIEPEKFLVVTGVSQQTKDFHWLRSRIPAGAHAHLTDVTSGLATLAVMGPRSRDLLQALTGDDLSNEVFAFGTSREIDLGYARVRASRVSYVGELGWELYAPSEFALGVYDAIVEEGGPHGLRLAGYHALNSLRIEKAFRHWGHDIGPMDNPMQAGLSFAVNLEKNGGFIGREALLEFKSAAVTRRLVQLCFEDREAMPLHEEPIYRDGELVGHTTSAMFGHTLGRSVALGYVSHPDGVNKAFLDAGPFEVEIACERFAARASFRPLYDPKGERMRA